MRYLRICQWGRRSAELARPPVDDCGVCGGNCGDEGGEMSQRHEEWKSEESHLGDGSLRMQTDRNWLSSAAEAASISAVWARAVYLCLTFLPSISAKSRITDRTRHSHVCGCEKYER